MRCDTFDLERTDGAMTQGAAWLARKAAEKAANSALAARDAAINAKDNLKEAWDDRNSEKLHAAQAVRAMQTAEAERKLKKIRDADEKRDAARSGRNREKETRLQEQNEAHAARAKENKTQNEAKQREKEEAKARGETTWYQRATSWSAKAPAKTTKEQLRDLKKKLKAEQAGTRNERQGGKAGAEVGAVLPARGTKARGTQLGADATWAGVRAKVTALCTTALALKTTIISEEKIGQLLSSHSFYPFDSEVKKTNTAAKNVTRVVGEKKLNATTTEDRIGVALRALQQQLAETQTAFDTFELKETRYMQDDYARSTASLLRECTGLVSAFIASRAHVPTAAAPDNSQVVPGAVSPDLRASAAHLASMQAVLDAW